jgi:ADP-ribose pyrophosphatase YjhB (NUDIX family)
VTWLEDSDWKRIQALLPIVTVDALVLDGGEPPRVGLILRETPAGQRWNLVGGRIRRGESVAEALVRELRDALGEDAAFEVDLDRQPDFVAQYGPFEREPFANDPRKHAVGLTFAVTVRGEIQAQNEALEFRWFDLAAHPSRDKWGFEQDRVAEATLKAVGLTPRFGGP